MRLCMGWNAGDGGGGAGGDNDRGSNKKFILKATMHARRAANNLIQTLTSL